MTRTRYSFYNFLVSTIAAVILPLIGFIKVRLFVAFYGSDINGLQITIAQVITFINICELAYSLAFRQLMFKPLAEEDRERVKEIYYGAVRIFRITGAVVLVSGLAVGALFPYFQASPLDYIHTAGTFWLMVFPYGVSYFLMGPNFLIMADQKEYRINIWIQSLSILRMILMVTAIRLELSFFWILVIDALNVLAANTAARRIALKEYPWLKEEPENKTDRSFGKKAGYAVIQRLSELATTQTDNIVVTGFMGYVMSSVYGTYSYLTDNIGKITQTMVTSPMNSFGNLFNDEHADRYGVFTEFFSFATYVSTIVAVSIFVVMPQFVPLWMNNPLYEASVPICFLFGLNIFYLTMRQPVMIARDANGLYVNAKNNAYLMAVSKIVLSVLLVQKLGLLGVILATTLTNWTVDFLYNPKLVYTHVFGRDVRSCYRMVLGRVLTALIIGAAGFFLWNCMIPEQMGLFAFVKNTVLLGLSVVLMTTLVYTVCYDSFRRLFHRLKSLLAGRSQKA